MSTIALVKEKSSLYQNIVSSWRSFQSSCYLSLHWTLKMVFPSFYNCKSKFLFDLLVASAPFMFHLFLPFHVCFDTTLCLSDIRWGSVVLHFAEMGFHYNGIHFHASYCHAIVADIECIICTQRSFNVQSTKECSLMVNTFSPSWYRGGGGKNREGSFPQGGSFSPPFHLSFPYFAMSAFTVPNRYLAKYQLW